MKTLDFKLQLALATLVVLLAAPPARADAPSSLSFSLGPMISRHMSPSGVGLLEYRDGYSLIQSEAATLNPVLGILAGTAGQVYGYGGLRLIVPISPAWHWENAVGIGGYRRGDGPELYGTLQFCLSVGLTYRVWSAARAGIQVFHVSNAGLGAEDPGANSFAGVLEWPI